MQKVHLEATWYVLCTEEKAFWNNSDITVKWHSDAQVLSVRTPELSIEPQDMPDVAGWSYKIHRLNDPGFLKPVTSNKYTMDRMNDFRTWIPMVVVSTKARQLLEKLDPDGGQFFQFEYIDVGSGKTIKPELHHWLPIRRFWFNRKKNPGKQPTERKLFHLPEPDSSGVWQLGNNKELREFVLSFPTWGMSTGHTHPFFRNDVYKALMSARMTGLEEKRGLGALIFGGRETVGHIL